MKPSVNSTLPQPPLPRLAPGNYIIVVSTSAGV